MGTRIDEEWLLKNGVTREQIDAGDPHLARRRASAPCPPPRATDGMRRGLFVEIAGFRPPSQNEVTKVGVKAGIRVKNRCRC
jgi:hypothetical protein